MKSEPIYRERLLRLAEFLDNLPPEKFDIETWVGHEWGGKPDLSCGTTACGLGWATTMPEFRDLGLRMLGRGGHTGHVGLERHELESLIASTWRISIRRSAEAALEIFGLEKHETETLFIADDGLPDDADAARLPADATAKDLAAHIRAFVGAQ